MTPVDLRNCNFEDLQERLQGLRLAALSAWRQYGPGTTRDVARRGGMDLLTFRPRTTELHQLGFLVLTGHVAGHEGIYAARSDGELRAWLIAQRVITVQPELSLNSAKGASS